MTDTQPNLFTRDDTFFGVCEALGEDIGVHSNWLRLAFAGAFFFAPAAVVASYFGLGLVVALTRWIAPSPARPLVATGAVTDAEPVAHTAPAAANEPEALPLAA